MVPLSNVNDHTHRCGNCQFWTGERKPGVNKSRAEVRAISDTAKCGCPKQAGNLKTMDLRADHAAGSACRFYQPWDQLNA